MRVIGKYHPSMAKLWNAQSWSHSNCLGDTSPSGVQHPHFSRLLLCIKPSMRQYTNLCIRQECFIADLRQIC